MLRRSLEALNSILMLLDKGRLQIKTQTSYLSSPVIQADELEGRAKKVSLHFVGNLWGCFLATCPVSIWSTSFRRQAVKL